MTDDEIECCDRCGDTVLALVMVRTPRGRVLAFCGQHYTLHKACLYAEGYQVIRDLRRIVDPCSCRSTDGEPT